MEPVAVPRPLKLLNLVDVKVGNFLPALIIAPGLVGIVSLVD